jgi:hypothetical protein
MMIQIVVMALMKDMKERKLTISFAANTQNTQRRESHAKLLREYFLMRKKEQVQNNLWK